MVMPPVYVSFIYAYRLFVSIYRQFHFECYIFEDLDSLNLGWAKGRVLAGWGRVRKSRFPGSGSGIGLLVPGSRENPVVSKLNLFRKKSQNINNFFDLYYLNILSIRSKSNWGKTV